MSVLMWLGFGIRQSWDPSPIQLQKLHPHKGEVDLLAFGFLKSRTPGCSLRDWMEGPAGL
jgi:hypothetical protein